MESSKERSLQELLQEMTERIVMLELRLELLENFVAPDQFEATTLH